MTPSKKLIFTNAARKSARLLLDSITGKPEAIAPAPLYRIRTRLDDGAIRYYNLQRVACNRGAEHLIPKIDTLWYPFPNEAEAIRILDALRDIDKLGGTRLFKRGRVVKIFSYPQYN